MKTILTIPANRESLGERVHRVFRLSPGYFVVYLDLLPNGESDVHTSRHEYTGRGSETAAKNYAMSRVAS